MAAWDKTPPQLYDIVTGFFPETSPKGTWATDPRPLLVCGRAQHPETGLILCRIAYGTTNTTNVHKNDLMIGNMSLLDQLGLKRPTKFVLSSGGQMVVLPWTEEFFSPWRGKKTPILGRLPEAIQRHVGFTLSNLPDLPGY